MNDIFDITKQFIFYGSCHSHPVNVLIHVICVPIIVWSTLVFLSFVAPPSFFPIISYTFTPYLQFKFGWSTIIAIFYQSYYLVLDPIAALLYCPLLILWTLTATAFSTLPYALEIAASFHAISWFAQFIGHGVHEKRAPALFDNLIGAVVLAPFFVHLELLFWFGYKPELHKKIQVEVGKQITVLEKKEGERKQAIQKGNC